MNLKLVSGLLFLIGGILFFNAETLPLSLGEQCCVECEEVCESAPFQAGGTTKHPQVGKCKWFPQTKGWQCRPTFPTMLDPYWAAYRECISTSSETEQSCLLAWVEQKGFKLCGPTAPGTADEYVDGSGEIEVPYAGSSKELDKYAAHYQCTGESLGPPNAIMRAWLKRR